MGKRSRTAVMRSATILLIVLCVAYGVEPLFAPAFSRSGIGSLTPALLGLAAFSVALAHVIWRGTQLVESGKPWSLVIAAIIAVGMYLQFGPTLVALPAILCGAAAFSLTRLRAAWLVLIVVGCSYVVLAR